MLELKHIGYSVHDESGVELRILNDISLTIPDNKLVVVWLIITSMLSTSLV